MLLLLFRTLFGQTLPVVRAARLRPLTGWARVSGALEPRQRRVRAIVPRHLLFFDGWQYLVADAHLHLVNILIQFALIGYVRQMPPKGRRPISADILHQALSSRTRWAALILRRIRLDGEYIAFGRNKNPILFLLSASVAMHYYKLFERTKLQNIQTKRELCL